MRRRDKANLPTGTRRAARELAFRVLFQSKQGETPLLETFYAARASMRDESDDTFPELGVEALEFAQELLESYHTHQAQLDAMLQKQIKGWSFGQMAQTDLNILRLSTLEMFYFDTPGPVVMESAVRIARRFGGDDSGRFVNGVLASIERARVSGEISPGEMARTVKPLEPEQLELDKLETDKLEPQQGELQEIVPEEFDHLTQTQSEKLHD